MIKTYFISMKFITLILASLTPWTVLADDTVYVWKTKGAQTYSDVLPTRLLHYKIVTDEDITTASKNITKQLQQGEATVANPAAVPQQLQTIPTPSAQNNSNINSNINSTFDSKKALCDIYKKGLDNVKSSKTKVENKASLTNFYTEEIKKNCN